MIRFAATLVFALWASLGQAAIETWPALYDVRDVASDDVLNIRAAPSASAAIIGTLAHDATDVEVVDVDEDRRWGLVNSGETSGWVSLRFLEKHPRWAGSYPPVTTCFGTEPFWSIDLDGTEGAFTLMGESAIPINTLEQLSSLNRIDRFAFASDTVAATLREERCSDGMSDRTFGLSIEVLMQTSDGSALYSGCCTIQP